MVVKINDNLILEARARSRNLKDNDRQEIHNLEFGLRFPPGTQTTESGDDPTGTEDLKEDELPLGALSVRANVTNRVDLSLVPGEFLFEYNPGYFDVRRNPPEQQVLEKLYYQPCALCGRASNDPACRCSTMLPDADHAVHGRKKEEQL